jgi:hypothetical protein
VFHYSVLILRSMNKVSIYPLPLRGNRRFLSSALTLVYLNSQGDFQLIFGNITDWFCGYWNLISLYWQLRLISSLSYLIRSYYSCYFLIEFCVEVLLEVFILSIILFDFERNCYSNCFKDGLYYHENQWILLK